MITPGNMSMGLLAAMSSGGPAPAASAGSGRPSGASCCPDRTFRLCGAVTQKDDAPRTVELDVWIENDEGERPVIGTATVALGVERIFRRRLSSSPGWAIEPARRGSTCAEDGASAWRHRASRHPGGTRSSAAEHARTDDFGFDPAFRDRVQPFFRFLHDRYWRVEATGTQHICRPTGPALFVANHSGAIPFDGAMIVTTVEHAQRAAAPLPLRSLRREPRAGRRVLPQGRRRRRQRARTRSTLLARASWCCSSRRACRGWRSRSATATGCARSARASRAWRSRSTCRSSRSRWSVPRRSTRWSGASRASASLLGMPYVPVTPFFPLLGPLGTLPLPTKWFIRFGKPIRLPQRRGRGRWQRARIEAVSDATEDPGAW